MIKKKLKMKFKLLLLVLLAMSLGYGQANDDIQFPLVGKIQPRSSDEIFSSNWSIGGETLDRGYANYAEYKKYLGGLGAKKIRLQAGWAKCETEKGVYNFDWLDEIIDDAITQGLEPWLQTSYGNPIYEGGGDLFLSGGFPSSHEALEAWDKWVETLAMRYAGRVKIWEIWNESDLNIENSANDYAKLFIRTAEGIKAYIPNATIYALSMAHLEKTEYVKSFLELLKEKKKLNLVDEITLHGYTYRPEEIYPAYFDINTIVKSYADHITLNQGELGCPSENQTQYALNNYDWTEVSQSKWLLRKLLSDLGHDMKSIYFTIIDLNYIKSYSEVNGVVKKLKEPIKTVNTKGLIKSNPDNSVAYLKPSYSAYQNITSIFDHALSRVHNYPYTQSSTQSLSIYGYRSENFDRQLVAIWSDKDIPNNSIAKTGIDFQFPEGNFNDPVYVDMRTGKVYDIPQKNWTKNGTHYSFKNIPIYDSPILISDKNLIKLKKTLMDKL